MALAIEKRIELEMRGKEAHLIQDLNLDNCRASKLEGLTSDFTNLQTLSLINLGLQTLENFPKLGNLRKLELSDNRICGGLDALAGCPNLSYLSLSGNKIDTFDTLDPLKDLAHLRSLDLFNCEVTNEADYREKVFEKLTQLVYLDGFDREDKEQEDVDEEEEDDGEDDDEDDDDENSLDEDEDDDEEDEDEEDEEDEEDFEPIEDGEDDDLSAPGEDDDEDEDGPVDGEDDDEDEDDDDESRGTKRKHEDDGEDEA